MSVALPKKSTNVRNFFSWLRGDWPVLDGLGGMTRRWSAAAAAAEMFLSPERAVAPPALPEPAPSVIVPVPGFTPHLNARLWGMERGSSAPLVLLAHDWEGQIQDLMPLVTALLGLGARVLAFDAPAHGRSGGDTAHVIAMARAAAAVARAGQQVVGATLAAAIGHGLGASALVLALREPGFAPDRLVLLAPLVDLDLPLRQIAEVQALDAADLAALRLRIDRALGEPLAALTLEGQHPAIPTLIIHSHDDTVAPAVDAERVASIWPQASAHFTERLGHRRIRTDQAVLSAAGAFALAVG